MVELPRSGYLLGETGPLSGCIENRSTSSVWLCVSLIQRVIYSDVYDPSISSQANRFVILRGIY